MGHLTKPSNELVVDLINEANPNIQPPLQVGDVTFDAPTGAAEGASRNSIVVARGVRNAQGIGYRGQRTIRYDRLNLAQKMPPDDAETMEIMVPNDGFDTKLEVCDRLNAKYDLMIGADDIIDGPVDTSVLPATTVIHAKATSLAWTGSLPIKFVPDRPFYKDTFSTLLLDGLPEPLPSNAGLNSPTVQTNTTPTFVDAGNLYQPGNSAYPATGFIVSRNSEIEVAAAPRVGPGAVASAPDSTGYAYNLALAGANDWLVMVSIGSLENPVVDVETRYNVSAVISGPDDTELTLDLIRDETGYAFVGGGKTLRTISEVAPGVLQGAISVVDVSLLLGEITRNGAGGPLGSYMVRVMARRINTVAPRVLATFNAKVIN